MSTPSQSYQGPERRIDPDNRLSLDFHAPRALARFEDITPPEARRDAIATAKFREGDVMRDRLLRFVNRLDGRLSPEQQEFLDTTSEQYDTGFSAWKSTFQISDKDLMTLASKDAVMQWAATVSQKLFKASGKWRTSSQTPSRYASLKTHADYGPAPNGARTDEWLHRMGSWKR